MQGVSDTLYQSPSDLKLEDLDKVLTFFTYFYFLFAGVKYGKTCAMKRMTGI